MIDEVVITVKAGNGGDGKVSFRREKYVPKGGPDGGDGGRGGSVFLQAGRNINTLLWFSGKDRFSAQNGKPGWKRNRFGEDGRDLDLRVPIGTEVHALRLSKSSHRSRNAQAFGSEAQAQTGDKLALESLASSSSGDEKIADLEKDGERICIAKGGRGGKGNTRFKSSTNTTPKQAELGEAGEEKTIRLSLKLLADVGLVGLPNAGKSTLLSVLTNAKPEIANYPFTTLSPNLGMLNFGEKQLIIADIPGLIEGASQGQGLGIKFLKHIERCKLLVYLLFPQEEWLADDKTTDLGPRLYKQFKVVRKELEQYNLEMINMTSLIVCNKVDLLSEIQVRQVDTFFKKKKMKSFFISAATGMGVNELREAVKSIT